MPIYTVVQYVYNQHIFPPSVAPAPHQNYPGFHYKGTKSRVSSKSWGGGDAQGFLKKR